MNHLNFFKVNRIIFAALIIGILIFAIVAFTMNQGKTTLWLNTKNPFTYAVPIVLIIGVLVGNFLFKKLFSQIKRAKNLQEKIGIYTTSSIVRYALMEGPIIFSIVAFLLSANIYFLIFTSAGVLYFFSLMPKPEKVTYLLELTFDEKSELGLH